MKLMTHEEREEIVTELNGLRKEIADHVDNGDADEMAAMDGWFERFDQVVARIRPGRPAADAPD